MSIVQKNKQLPRVLWCDLALAVTIFTVTLFVIDRFAIIGFDPHHTGLMYKTALDVARGGVIFRDTFTQYGALTACLQAWAIRLLGESATSVLFSTAFFYAASHTMLFVLARRFFNKKTSLLIAFTALLLAPFYTWTFHPWSSVYALFFLLLSLFFMLKSIEKQSALYAVLTGFCGMLAFWCRQPVGLVTLLASVLCFGFFALCQKKENAHSSHRFLWLGAALFGGALLGFLLFFIPLAANGALHDFYRQCIEGMSTFAQDRSGVEQFGIFGIIGTLLYCLFIAPLVQWFSPGINYIWLVLPLSSLTLFILNVRKLWRNACIDGQEKDIRAAHLIVSVFAIASWHQYYPVSCYRHWYWAAFPSVICVFLLVRAFWQHPPKRLTALLTTQRRRLLAPILTIVVLFGSNVVYHGTAGIIKQAQNTDRVLFYHEVYSHLNGLYLDPEVAVYYDSLFDKIAVLQTAFPQKNIINTTENGVFALFGENFCPIFNNSGDFYYKEFPTLLADYIKTERPIIIGPEAPDDTYILWFEPTGDPDDPYAEYHRMPARIYLPVEIYHMLSEQAGGV